LEPRILRDFAIEVSINERQDRPLSLEELLSVVSDDILLLMKRVVAAADWLKRVNPKLVLVVEAVMQI
jgi:hypothetical protein